MRACAFFPPSLDPVLDRGKRDKDAVVSPQVPTRGPVGQTVFDHKPYRQINDAVGVLTAKLGDHNAGTLVACRCDCKRRSLAVASLQSW